MPVTNTSFAKETAEVLLRRLTRTYSLLKKPKEPLDKNAIWDAIDLLKKWNTAYGISKNPYFTEHEHE